MEQSSKRKIEISLFDLISAILYAFHCQRKYFKM